jgi:hypothetical protein
MRTFGQRLTLVNRLQALLGLALRCKLKALTLLVLMKKNAFERLKICPQEVLGD